MADLLAVGVLFAAAALVGGAAARLDLSVIPWYVLVGVVLSPSVAGSVSPFGVALPVVEATEFVTLGAELGIVFLLLFLGMGFNLNRLLASADRIGRVGVLDLAVNFGAGLVVGVLLFDEALAVVLVAGIVYISSSAIVTKSLIDLGWIADSEAEPTLGTLVFEDLFVAVYLAVVVALVGGGAGDPVGVATDVGVALAFVVALVAFARFATDPLERLLATTSPEATVLRAVGVTVLVAGLALALGVSEAVAAFFVGMAFGSTTHVERLEQILEPIRDVFAAVFFVWIGLTTDVAAVAGVASLVAVAAVATTPTKLVSGFLGGRVYGLSPRRSARVGLSLVARGEFSLILGTVALTGAGTTLSAATAETVYAFAVGYVLVMSVLGTLLMRYSAPFERFATARFDDADAARR